MKELITEHADLVIGVLAAGTIIGMFLKMTAPGEIIYNAVAAFASGVC